MTLGQETRWAYSTKLPSPHGAVKCSTTNKELQGEGIHIAGSSSFNRYEWLMRE